MSNAKLLVDTNIVSYVMKDHPLARAYVKHLEGHLLAISFITVGELYYGAEKGRWGEKNRKQLETTLRNFVVLPYDHEIARCYARLVAERERIGRPISFNDAWIAACAVRHGIPLVTHNAKDFADISSLKVITETAV
ncbi:MAG: type II toxin-antitoxin system VapC family toxin [Candidatus Hydrogenedentes bacterium]|nr:type II toxin-antitoxin system VapC family toxin [Candidatus Hydrogenedentota bacterium]